MENLQETMTAWLRSSQTTEGQLEEAMMATLRDGRSIFLRELLQTMACAWQYELWNIFFRRLQASRTEAKHTHCREQHEVGWYARQVGLSPDALSAALKRFCGKTAGAILTELLTEEAKVCLRNPSLSVQEVAEMLHFADQSAFGKFFKRQCGVSPMQYKKETEQPG